MLNPPFPAIVAERIATADALPYGQLRLDALDEAARVADSLRDIAAGFAVRRRLINEAAYCLRYDFYAVAFTWCLAAARREPERYPFVDLLGHYQSVIGKMVNFPDVTREQFESLFADVAFEFQTHGFSARPLQLLRRAVAIDFGDTVMATAAEEEWRKHRRDELSDGAEYEMLTQIHHDNFVGDDEAAARHGVDFFAKPRRTNYLDPSVGCEILMPLLRLGRRAEADVRFQTASGPWFPSGYVWSRGYLLEYLGWVGDFSTGVREFEIQLPLALAQSDPLSQFYGLRPAALLFDRMAATGVRTVALKPGPSCAQSSGQSEPAVVRDWLNSRAAAIAERFDRRNGNSFYSDWLRRTFAPWSPTPHATRT